MTQELSYEVPAAAIEAFAAKVQVAYPEGLEEKCVRCVVCVVLCSQVVL